MIIEIKQSDSREEVEAKLQLMRDHMAQKEEERKQRIRKYFGILKREDIDPLEIQRKLRDEWD